MYLLAGENNEIRGCTEERELIQMYSAGRLEALRDYEWSWLLSWLKGVPTPHQPCSAALSDTKMMLVSEELTALVTQPSFDEGD